ncbi:hypothetical protein SK803_45820 [Lentzea sp. BCCO 10_0856]|uniref:Vitamin K epoxide reductase family protein n=1 Tax=Lentzea miocenica TaxID=3095431 RepID=A0ABU4TH92_9PSEU|nr:hypothetical protein [Lentzea sp. BCCO 10_0856]MDX8037559.1 hypothetical protein [Lentzea sp. BCCO 10_0856]
MDLGERRRLRREQLRTEHGTTEVIHRDDPRVAVLVVTLVIAGSMIGGFAHMPIGTALNDLYCTPESCTALPQVLTGWAIAVAPLPVYLWHRTAALYLGVFLGGFMGTLFITSNQDIPVDVNPITGLWALPLTYFLVGMLFVPFTIGIAWLVRPARRVAAVAVPHWLLLAGLILWLA